MRLPDPGTLRLLYNNCNGLQVNEYFKSQLRQKAQKKKEEYLNETKEITKVGGVIGAMKMLSVNVMCLSETQTAWEKGIVRQAITKEIKKQDKYASITGSSSEVISASFVKPGGTAVFSDGDWTSRIIKKGMDSTGLGRWSYTTVAGKKDTKLTFICGYRCCNGQKISTVGTLTSFFQQYCLLRKRGIKN